MRRWRTKGKCARGLRGRKLCGRRGRERRQSSGTGSSLLDKHATYATYARRNQEAQSSAPGPPHASKKAPRRGIKGVRGLPASEIKFVPYTAAFRDKNT